MELEKDLDININGPRKARELAAIEYYARQQEAAVEDTNKLQAMVQEGDGCERNSETASEIGCAKVKLWNVDKSDGGNHFKRWHVSGHKLPINDRNEVERNF